MRLKNIQIISKIQNKKCLEIKSSYLVMVPCHVKWSDPGDFLKAQFVIFRCQKYAKKGYMEMRKWIYIVPLKSVPGCSILHYFAYKLVAYNKKVCFIKKIWKYIFKTNTIFGNQCARFTCNFRTIIRKVIKEIRKLSNCFWNSQTQTNVAEGIKTAPLSYRLILLKTPSQTYSPTHSFCNSHNPLLHAVIQLSHWRTHSFTNFLSVNTLLQCLYKLWYGSQKGFCIINCSSKFKRLFG